MLVDLIKNNSAESLTAAVQKKQELGKDEFLKLLVTQLKNQDPLEPMKNEQFVAELAQFNALEQMINLNKSFESMLSMQSLSQASSFIGANIAWVDADGAAQEGIVSSVSVIDKTPKLNVGALEVGIEQIVAIAPA